MPRIPNNLSDRAIGMLEAGMLTEYVARHVGCSSRATAISRTRISAIDPKLPLRLLLTHMGFIITESVRKVFVIVCGRTVYTHDVLTSDEFYRNVIVKIFLIEYVLDTATLDYRSFFC